MFFFFPSQRIEATFPNVLNPEPNGDVPVMILIEGTLLKYMSATTVTGSISLHSFFPNLTESRVDAIMLKPSGTNFTPDQFYLYAGQF